MTYVEYSAKLDAMRSLPKGWDGYDADPPSDTAIRMAQAFLLERWIMAAPTVEPVNVSPSPKGVGIEFHGTAGNRVAVGFRNNGECYATFAEYNARSRRWKCDPVDGRWEWLHREIADYLSGLADYLSGLDAESAIDRANPKAPSKERLTRLVERYKPHPDRELDPSLDYGSNAAEPDGQQG